jgi:RNase P/RNase MRP subunit p30
MRKPHDLAAIGFLFGLQEETCLDAVSTNPASIVTRNRAKLDSKFVAPGITLLKEGAAK